MLRPFAHPVACCDMLLGVVAQSLKPVKLLATCKRTQHLPTPLRVVTSHGLYIAIKSVKVLLIRERNEYVIDFYRLIDTIDINQIRFILFLTIYRLTTPGTLAPMTHY